MPEPNSYEAWQRVSAKSFRGTQSSAVALKEPSHLHVSAGRFPWPQPDAKPLSGAPSGAATGTPLFRTSSEASSEKSEPLKRDHASAEAASVPPATRALKESIIKFKLDETGTPNKEHRTDVALVVEGHYWQQQGLLLYFGLTKTDPFIKLVRNFTTDLFRSEKFSKYVRRKRKHSRAGSGSSSTHATETSASNCGGVCSGPQDHSSGNEEGDIFEEDALVVTKNKADASDDAPDTFRQAPRHAVHLPGIASLHALHFSKNVLPRRSAITTAIHMYFQYVNPFVPILDEDTFMCDIVPPFRSFVPDREMILLVVRLGYMTLIPSTDANAKFTRRESELLRDIMCFKCDQYMGVVAFCVPEEKVRVKSTFSVESKDCLGLGGADAQLLFFALVNHALSIGLNRDPTRYQAIKSIRTSASHVRMWRNLWLFIVAKDAGAAVYCGTPLKIPDVSIGDVATPETDDASDLQYHDTVQDVLMCYRRIELFGRYFYWLLTSRIERSMIKTQAFATSVFIRVINLKRALECQLRTFADPQLLQPRVDVTDSLLHIAMTEAELFVGNFRVLTLRHDFAVKQCIENPEHILKSFTGHAQLSYHSGAKLLQFLSLAKLKSMAELCHKFCLAKIYLLRRKRSHDTSADKREQHNPNTTGDAFPTNPHVDDTPPSKSIEHDGPFLNDDSVAAGFDALLANRAMHSNENTVNTYGVLQARHMDVKFQKEVFDLQSMIGNDELTQLFEIFGELD
ncbi:hypothetical protein METBISCDRAFT_22642 [Metschnikowia bicuspidata]|uniref:Transcription factor domain-containing protein n=1 Tax=Metschnikowia bicuspidata TaxID=27322 RepID=A0A4P9ZG44_9ASCO|nr:hypothetical protein METBISCDRAFT_22642 [Metschnikowia bicuspidata]